MAISDFRLDLSLTRIDFTKDQEYVEDHRPCLTCNQLPDVHVRGFPQQTHQSWDSSTVLQGNLVVIVSFPIDEVPQSSAGAPVHLRHPMIQQVHQQRDTTLPPDLKDRENLISLLILHTRFFSFLMVMQWCLTVSSSGFRCQMSLIWVRSSLIVNLLRLCSYWIYSGCVTESKKDWSLENLYLKNCKDQCF